MKVRHKSVPMFDLVLSNRIFAADELDEVSEAEDFLDDFEVMESRSQRRRDASERSGHKSAVEQVKIVCHSRADFY